MVVEKAWRRDAQNSRRAPWGCCCSISCRPSRAMAMNSASGCATKVAGRSSLRMGPSIPCSIGSNARDGWSLLGGASSPASAPPAESARRGPRRRYYRLTPHGREALQAALSEWHLFSHAVARVLGEARGLVFVQHQANPSRMKPLHTAAGGGCNHAAADGALSD